MHVWYSVTSSTATTLSTPAGAGHILMQAFLYHNPATAEQLGWSVHEERDPAAQTASGGAAFLERVMSVPAPSLMRSSLLARS